MLSRSSSNPDWSSDIWLPIVDAFRTLVACMPAELRILFHAMDGMLPAAFRPGWTCAEATDIIREALRASFTTQEPNYRLNGFTHRKPSNRAKSPSVEQRSNPCSIARAARWASGISFAPPPSRIKRRPSISW